MLKSIGIVVAVPCSRLFSCRGNPPLLSRLFPGDFVRGRIPSNNALLASTALFVVVSILRALVAHVAGE